MKEEIQSIKDKIKILYIERSAQDFLEAYKEIQDYANDLYEEAQEEICNNVEKLVDSFGGDISLRELKGE